MEPVLDNRDEEEVQRERRAEKRERMKQEKQLQEERRQMVRHYLPLAVSIAGVALLLIVGILAVVEKPNEDATSPAQMAEADSKGQTQSVQPKEEETSSESGLEHTVSDLLSVGMDREQAKTGSVDAESKSDPQNETTVSTPLYAFTSNDNAVTMYSEEVVSTNAILIDESTGTIVASKGAKERINPASMTKVLTVLVAAEHITEAHLDKTFTMTKEITDYAYVNDCSSVGFLDGEKVTVRDLFYGTVLPSGGDAAVGLAVYIAGSHEAFVDMMNNKLKELGLSDSAHFTNCVGLYDEEHYCTVYDMAVMMKAAMQNELCKEFLSAHTYTTAPTTEHPEGITISNWFLRRIEDKDTGGEVICAKTGYVVQSKNCAVSYGTSAAGTPYICVTVGATSSWRCIYDHVEIYNRYVSVE